MKKTIPLLLATFLILLSSYQLSHAQHDNYSLATVITPGTASPTVVSGNLNTATYSTITPYRIPWSSTTSAVPVLSERDQWLKFTATSGTYEILLTSPTTSASFPVSFNISVDLYELSAAGDSMFLHENLYLYRGFFAGGGSFSAGSGGEVINLRNGKDYLIRIGTTSPAHASQNYTLSVKKIADNAVNEEAWTATTLTVGSPCSSLYTHQYGSVYHNEPLAPCFGNINDRLTFVKTMWFKFIAPPSGLVKISSDIYHVGDALFASASLFKYNGGGATNYDNYELIMCGLIDERITYRSNIYSTYLTPGEEYYIQVASNDTYWGDQFCFQVDEVISNHIDNDMNICSWSPDVWTRTENYYDTSSAFRYKGWTDLGNEEFYELDPTISVTNEWETYEVDYSYNFNLLGQIRNTTSGINLRSGIDYRRNRHTGGLRTTSDGRAYSKINYHISNAHTASGNYDIILYYRESDVAELSLNPTNFTITQIPGSCDATATITSALEGSITDIIPTQQGYNASTGVRWVQFSTPTLGSFYLRKTNDLIATVSDSSHVTCPSGTNGSATVSVTGGLAPYDYNWLVSEVSVGTSASISTLPAGTHSCIVTDALGAKDTVTVIINAPAAFDIVSTSTNVNCAGSATGSASVSVSGGTAPYTYAWAPSGGTAATATDLADGTYTVTITDNNGCTATRSFTITEPTGLSFSFTKLDNSCPDGNSGSIDLAISGGVEPYTYSWSNGMTSQDISALPAGTYTCDITDNNGCTITTTGINITSPVVDTTVVNTTICAGQYSTLAEAYITESTDVYNTYTTAAGCDSVVKTGYTVEFNDIATTTSTSTSWQNDLTAKFTNLDCEAIATIQSGYDLGQINTTVTLDVPLPHVDSDVYFVSRVYDIIVENNNAATVTLYYTQEDIDNYNDAVGPSHPLYPQIGSAGENMQITAEHMVDVGGTLVPEREAIMVTSVWNAVMERWEVTFETSGFSTFYLHSHYHGFPLNTHFTNIAAQNAGPVNIVNWAVGNQDNTTHYQIERSENGQEFITIGEQKVTDKNILSHKYIDENPVLGLNFYRILSHGHEGKHYSQVVKAELTADNTVTIYPNPTHDIVNVQLNRFDNSTVINVLDITGKVLESHQVKSPSTQVSLKAYASGTYYIQIKSVLFNKTFKITKNS